MNNNLPFYYISHFISNPTVNEEHKYPKKDNLPSAYAHRIFGGITQQSRMILDKLKSLDKALIRSYQAADMRKLDSIESFKVLINPDKLKVDYDDKILSTRFNNEVKAGDILEWLDTNTYWLVYLQDLEEKAYFRSEIRRCSYLLRWKDEDGIIRETYAAERGPVETKIDFIQKNSISVDEPNHSLHILMPKDKYTVSYFHRYAKFYVPDADQPERDICWRVEAFDSVSTPGILEINAVEYYSNKFEDDTELGVVKGKVLTKTEQIELADTEENIIGSVFIKPRKQETYKYIGTDIQNWSYDEKLPIEVLEKTDNSITLKWNSSYSGQFKLTYGNLTKTIVVESLF